MMTGRGSIAASAFLVAFAAARRIRARTGAMPKKPIKGYIVDGRP
jgi:hypothetical protein